MSQAKLYVSRKGNLLCDFPLNNAWGFAPRIRDALGEEWNLERPDILDVLSPFEANVFELILPGRYIQGAEDIQRYKRSLHRFSEAYPVTKGSTCFFQDALSLMDAAWFGDFEYLAWHLTTNETNPWKVKTDPPEGHEASEGVNWVREYNVAVDTCPLYRSDVMPTRAKMRHIPERISGPYEKAMNAVAVSLLEDAEHSNLFKKEIESFYTGPRNVASTRHIKPLVRKQGKLWRVKPVGDKDSYPWSEVTTEMSEPLKALAEIKTLHIYAYYGFFKPTADEVFRCIPEHLKSRVAYFEVQGPNTSRDMHRENLAFNAGYHVAVTTLYEALSV